MEYDHLIVPGVTYRRSEEEVMRDVRADAAEWYNREFKVRVKMGGDRREIARKLEKDTEGWIALEFQRRMNWNYEEESTEPL